MNISAIRTQFKNWIGQQISLDYWGVNNPEGFWTNFDNPQGVRILALPVKELSTTPSSLSFVLDYELLFRFPRDVFYDDLPLPDLEDWLWTISRAIQEEGQCIFGQVLSITVFSDIPISVTVDQGSEDWLVSVMFSIGISGVYIQTIPN